jgi:hypothetical protein
MMQLVNTKTAVGRKDTPGDHRLLRGGFLVTLLLAPAAGCGNPSGDGGDAGPKDAGGGVDAADAQRDADPGVTDAAPPRPRDAGPLPCEQPGWFSPHSVRIHQFALSTRGEPGYGLNLDGLPTCAPQGAGCWGGVDNQGGSMHIDESECEADFSPIEPGGLNYLLDTLLLSGNPPESFLMEARNLVRAGDDSAGTFELIVQHGQWIDNPVCPDRQDVIDGQIRCDYVVDDTFYQRGTCTPLSVLDNARIEGGLLTAGGPGYNVWLVYSLPLWTGGFLLHQARVQAQVVWDGDELSLTSGIIAGVVCPWDLATTAADITNADPACIVQHLPAPDLEVGCSAAEGPDGISAAFLFEAGPAHLVGFVRL